jgi:hypothetical protein
MNSREAHLVDRIDRDRERRASSKPAKDARRLQIRDMAREAFRATVARLTCPNERLELTRATAWAAREQFVSLQDDAGACAFFGSLASAPDSVLPKAIAKATAEQLFAKAANDGAKG